MITVSAAIMAHPKRTDFVPDLLQWLGDPDLPVVWDEQDDRWDTGKRSMLAYDPGCTHHVVIQDDVLPCKDLLIALPKILARVPESAPLCGYVGTVRPNAEAVSRACRDADSLGASFITMHTLNWGPLIVVPTAAIPDMIDFSDRLVNIPNYDRRLSRYWELEAGIRVWYAWPSLVDHRDGPSLVPGRMGTYHRKATSGRRGSRVAYRFLGMEASALECDWSGPVVHADTALRYSGRYSGSTVTYRHKRSGKCLVLPANSHRIERIDRNPFWERADEPCLLA